MPACVLPTPGRSSISEMAAGEEAGERQAHRADACRARSLLTCCCARVQRGSQRRFERRRVVSDRRQADIHEVGICMGLSIATVMLSGSARRSDDVARLRTVF